MKLIFERIMVPNFVRTSAGVIPLESLDKEDLMRYSDAWEARLIENWEKRKKERGFGGSS